MATPPRGVARGGHLPAGCRRRSKSPYFAPGPRIPRLPMRFRVRSTSRRSRWFASATLRRRAVGPDLSAKCAAWPTGSAGEANNRSRRESDSGQNAEPTSSARTKPGPSAMAVNNRCRRRVLPRRASLFAEPALPVGHAVGWRDIADLKVGTTPASLRPPRVLRGISRKRRGELSAAAQGPCTLREPAVRASWPHVRDRVDL